MKKKYIIVAACLVVLIAAGMFFFRAQPIVKQPYSVGLNEVYIKSDIVFGGVSYKGGDYVYDADAFAVFETLSRYKCRRTPGNPFPMPVADMVWEITFSQSFKPYHIVLGKDSVMYSSGTDLFSYKILEPEALMAELESLL